jgi:hypothetical protein
LKIINSENPEKMQRQEFDQSAAWYWMREDDFDRPIFVASKIVKKKLDYSQSQIKKIDPLPIEEYCKETSKYNIEQIGNIEKSNSNINQNIIPLIKENPNVAFDFVITAIPTLSVQVNKLYSGNLYIVSLLILKNFVTALADYPNARVFAFGLEKFTDDLRLYKDVSHYHIEINNYIVELISQNKNILNKDNIDEYLMLFDRKVSQYRLPEKWNPKNEKNISPKGRPLSKMEARNLM